MRVQEGYVRPVKAKKGHILPITNSGKDIAVQLKTYACARGRNWRERRRTCNLVVRAQSSLSAAIDTPNPASLSAAG